MKKHYIVKQTTLLVLLITSVISLCFADEVKEIRELDEFKSIQQYGKFTLIIEQSEIQEIIMVGDESVLSEIETSISNNSLIIKPIVAKSDMAYKDITIYIKTPVLEQVKQAGSGNIICDRFETDEITFKLLGSGNIEFKELYVSNSIAEIAGTGDLKLVLKSEKLKCNIYGSGNLILEGYAEETDYTITGSGKIDSKLLIQDYCSASIFGSGSIYLNVRGTLDVEVFGGGSIYYKGNPEINFNSKGSGRIHKLAEN